MATNGGLQMKFNIGKILAVVAVAAAATFAAPVVAGALGLSGTLGGIVGGAITGAAGGAITSAITKQPIGKGALMGAAGGAIGGALNAPAMGGTTGAMKTSVAGMPAIDNAPSLIKPTMRAFDRPFGATPEYMSKALPFSDTLASANPFAAAAARAAPPLADTLAKVGGTVGDVAQAAAPMGNTLLDKFKGIQSSLGFTGKDVFSGIMEATKKDPAVAQAEALMKAQQAASASKYQGLAEALQRAGYMGYRG
jgi:hypothetical protein